jgi:DNA-binding FadR family transcriptional regulator
MSTTGTAPVRATMAEEIERRLAREILRGERAPGSQLPPVRALALTCGVTAPTIQRVIERLEAGGLVSVRRGSGITVNDPHRVGDLSLLPLWFDALADQPARAAAILEDFLALRRAVAGHLLRTAAPRIVAHAAQLATLLAAVEAATTLDAVADADLAFTRAVVEAAGSFAVGAIMHTTERLVRVVPHLSTALYGDRAYYRRVLRRTVSALADATLASATVELEAVLAAWDRRTVARFRAHLGG